MCMTATHILFDYATNQIDEFRMSYHKYFFFDHQIMLHVTYHYKHLTITLHKIYTLLVISQELKLALIHRVNDINK